MNGNCLLDTNIIIALFNNDPHVQDSLRSGVQVYVSSTVLGELYYGAYRSQRVSANVRRIDQFRAAVTVLSCDGGTAREYGEIRSRLRAKGRPLPENDIWIAAVCKQHDLTLLTRDRHFEEITGLVVEAW